LLVAFVIVASVDIIGVAAAVAVLETLVLTTAVACLSSRPVILRAAAMQAATAEEWRHNWSSQAATQWSKDRMSFKLGTLRLNLPLPTKY